MKINNTVGNVHIFLDTSRLDQSIKRAQSLLNQQIVADCMPLVPFRNGALRSSVNFPQGIYGGEIEWNTPYAHYIYSGEKYGPNIPIKDSGGNLTGWWSPPVKHPTGQPLQYHHPGTEKEWFEKAKERHGQQWIDLVRRTAGRD